MLIYKKFKSYKKFILNDIRSKKLIFESDHRNYYVYRITDNEFNKHYYGSRVTKLEPIDDLGIKYFSSSSDKEFLTEQKENPKKFKYKIIKIFNNMADSVIYESYLHQFFQVSSNNFFINRSNQTPFGFNITGNTQAIQKGVKTRNKIDYKTGLTISQKIDNKNSIALRRVNPISGLTKAQEGSIKCIKTMQEINPKTGNSLRFDSIIKRFRTMQEINPKTGLTKFQETSNKAVKFRSGCNHGKFKGIYIIKKLEFYTAKDAAALFDISPASIITWCKNSDKNITKRSYYMSNYIKSLGIPEHIIGKTYKDIGFDFKYLHV